MGLYVFVNIRSKMRVTKMRVEGMEIVVWNEEVVLVYCIVRSRQIWCNSQVISSIKWVLMCYKLENESKRV